MTELGENNYRDFLDVLRELNSDNINDNPEKRDDFFKSLYGYAYYIYYREGHEYRENFEHSINLFEYKYTNPNEFYNKRILEIRLFLLTARFMDMINHLDTNCDNSNMHRPSHVAEMYAVAIETIRKFVTNNYPEYFSKFKEDFLGYLIYNYCYNYREFSDKDKFKERINILGDGFDARKKEYLTRLNKIIVIYAETIGYLTIEDEVPYLIDDLFINEIRNNRIYRNNFDALLEIINNLLTRKIKNNKAR